MSKKRKFKIPDRTENRTKQLEKKYKNSLIDMLKALFPEDDFAKNSFFQRIAVTDIINPISDKKEYGVVFICNNTLVSIVEAFEEIDNYLVGFCLEGLAAGMNQCDEVKFRLKEFDYKRLIGIIYEQEPRELENDYIYANRDVVKNQPFVFQVNEFVNFNEIFNTRKNGWFPIRIFNSKSNPQASAYFEESKHILKMIPNRRVSRI